MSQFLLFFLSLIGACAVAEPNREPSTEPIVPWIWGITVDDVSKPGPIVDAIRALSQPVTVRIVFDENTKPADYKMAVPALHAVAHVMGEILDSEYVKQLSVSKYAARAQQFFDAFKDSVDIWEVGNEINGEWLGKNADVTAKVEAANQIVKGGGGHTAVTLYYVGAKNECGDSHGAMIPWAKANLSETVKRTVDFVLVSWYPADCNNRKISQAEWQSQFDQLREIFPNSYLGFGESGCVQCNKTARIAKMQQQYAINVTTPGYIGGHFHWTWLQDAVPKTKPFWSAFDAVIKSRKSW